MITWNYRVFREDSGDFVIREVFYSNPKEVVNQFFGIRPQPPEGGTTTNLGLLYAEDGSILGCTANAVEPFGRTLEELTTSIADFQAALTLPVLNLTDMPQTAIPSKRNSSGQTLSSAEIRTRLGLSSNSSIHKEAS